MYENFRCIRLTGILDIDNKLIASQTWYPYEHHRPEHKCKLTCYSRESEEYYQTGENVIDGTRCSYDDADDICVQGKCIQMGCDMIADSHAATDACGVCGGDGSTCREKIKENWGTVTQLTKLMVIPRLAANISVRLIAGSSLALVIKERESGMTVYDGKRRYEGRQLEAFREGSKGSHAHGGFVTRGTKISIARSGENETVVQDRQYPVFHTFESDLCFYSFCLAWVLFTDQ